jgi:glycosyltransferase involved in cell wall biosynthesis
MWRSLEKLDQLFTADARAWAASRHLGSSVPVSVVSHPATPLPWPSERSMKAVTGALRGVRPGRLVLAIPWPENRDDLRWFRDLAQPRLEARPLCLIVGAPNRREVRMLVGAQGLERDFRVVTGRLNADMVSAVTRCADAVAVPACSYGGEVGLPVGVHEALALGGIPVVTNGIEDARVFAHERNGFLVPPGDDRAFASTLNQVLALPAVQRHMLGEEFARYTLSRRRWADVAETYGERYAALVGRPWIPVDLRAA